jgi:histidine triad (HIT) family protein
MTDCIFCKIAAGEIPSAKVYEDATKLAFMDINPVQPGHVLLIPKKHYERLTELPDETAADLAAALPRLARAAVAAAHADGFNIFQTNGRCAGQSVSHVHLHIIPRRNDDGYSFHWRPGQYAPGEQEAWRKKISDELAKTRKP